MAKQELNLQAIQGSDIADRLPGVLRAAVMGVSLTGFDICLQGVQPEELCHPLTKEQIAQLRACASFTRQETEVVYLPGAGPEDVPVFRVRYDMAGFDADGNAVSVQAEDAVGLRCGVRGGGDFRPVLTITDVEQCTLLPGGGVQRPGRLVQRLRRWLRKRGRDGAGESGWMLLGEAAEAVLEFLLEAIFDG